MKVRIIKRVLSGALAMALVLAPSMGSMAALTSDSGGDVSGNYGSSESGGSSSSSESSQPAAAPAVVYTESSTVAGIKSTVSGVYIQNKGIAGAVTTSAADIAAACNLGSNERPYTKVYDVDTKRSNLAWGCATNAAAAYGGTIYGGMNVELGKMVAGEYSLLEGTATVNMVFTVPKNVQGSNIAVIIVQPGGATTVVKAVVNNGAITIPVPVGQSMLAFMAY